MANFFENKDRRVIPNWRSFRKTTLLGELDSPFPKDNPPFTNLTIDDYENDWLSNKTIAHAGDLISAAIANGFEDNLSVHDAANFVLSNPDMSTPVQRSLAKKIVSTSAPFISSVNLSEIGIDEFHDFIDPLAIRKKIQHLKSSIREFNYNPITWVELSRNYSILGQRNQAISAMRAALQISPENRFVLRCAVRLFAHYGDVEFSHDLVRKNYLTNNDPWLTSAEIALATLRGRTSRFIKRGIELINSKNYSPFSISELASAIGTVELINGSSKKSRELFKKSLVDPNDNALAQAEWASKTDGQIEVNPTAFSIQNSFEAKALDDYQNQKFSDALNNAIRWFLDMPFLKRPVMLGSHIASALLDNREVSREILKAGLFAHPNDPQLINNLVYSLALDNKTTEGMEYLEKISNTAKIEKTTEVCLTATKGLIYFRSGFYEIGRKLYIDAINEASDIKNEYFNWIAILNYAREEILIRSEYADSIMNTVAQIPDNTSKVDVKQLKQQVLELYKKYKEE